MIDETATEDGACIHCAHSVFGCAHCNGTGRKGHVPCPAPNCSGNSESMIAFDICPVCRNAGSVHEDSPDLIQYLEENSS